MSVEHSDLRKEEIINACEVLYDKYHFKDITIKLIRNKRHFQDLLFIIISKQKKKFFWLYFKENMKNGK